MKQTVLTCILYPTEQDPRHDGIASDAENWPRADLQACCCQSGPHDAGLPEIPKADLHVSQLDEASCQAQLEE